MLDIRAENVFLKQKLSRLEYQCKCYQDEIQQLTKMALMKKQKYLKNLKSDAKMLMRDHEITERRDKKHSIR